MQHSARTRSRRQAAAVHAAAWLLLIGFAAAPAARAQDGGAQPAQAPPAGPPIVAVVDLDRVLDGSEQWADYLDERRRLRERMGRSLDKYEENIRLLRLDYRNLAPGTEAGAEKRRQLEAALNEYGEARERFQSRLRNLRAEALGELLDALSECVRRYAEQNGIDLVLKQQSLEASGDNPDELGARVAMAQVLYCRPRYDITEAVVADLNARYPGEIEEK